jgi:hypothetical protein
MLAHKAQSLPVVLTVADPEQVQVMVAVALLISGKVALHLTNVLLLEPVVAEEVTGAVLRLLVEKAEVLPVKMVIVCRLTLAVRVGHKQVAAPEHVLV